MDADVERERIERLDETRDDSNPAWADSFRPGTYGCHELLDRASTVADAIDGMILSHPACLLNSEWYALANRAATAIYELYRRVGAAHI